MRLRIAVGAAVMGISPWVLAYDPPAGFTRTGQVFSGSAIAFSADGKVAVASDSPSGGASIRVYPSLLSVGSAPLQTFSDPAWKFIAGIEFSSSDSIVFGENGTLETVLQGTLSSGAVITLAPQLSVPAINDLAIDGNAVLAVSAKGPGANDLVSIPLAGGSPATVIHSFGNGYGGGVAVSNSGQILLTDSNDPNFTGHAGRILRFDASFAPVDAIDLTPGGGSGAVDVALDSQGDVFVSTGATLTRIAPDLQVEPFGSFDAFSFPTFLAYRGEGYAPGAGGGVLLVSGFTDETLYAPGVFGIAPIPEPGGLALMALGLLALRRRR